MAEHVVDVDIIGGKFSVRFKSGRSDQSRSPDGNPVDRDAALEFLTGELQDSWDEDDDDVARITIGTKRTKPPTLREALRLLDRELVLPTFRRNPISNPSRNRPRRKP